MSIAAQLELPVQPIFHVDCRQDAARLVRWREVYRECGRSAEGIQRRLSSSAVLKLADRIRTVTLRGEEVAKKAFS